ncbi:MAG TPA: ferredoxin family protein [Acidobacteriota bacterium]|nr:ferredoxin family protein [Acidobacteriota bacterium]
MNSLDQPTLRVVLYEGSGSQLLDGRERFQILESLLQRGYSVSCAGEGVSPADGSTLLVLGRFPKEHAPTPEDFSGEVPVYVRNTSGLTASEIAEAADEVRNEVQQGEGKAWKPWFPVIDYDRCTNCMQCLSFCLFDVYGVSDDQKIQVQNHSNCKTDCPACSRVCPEVAILFPKYRSGPINGDEVSDEDLRREKMKVDISSLLGGDIYQTLRDRSARAQSRFSKERSEDRALKERKRCLKQLQALGEIPAEALEGLPSQEDIQSKAEQAADRLKGPSQGGE